MLDEEMSFQEKVVEILMVPSQNQMGFKFMQQSLKNVRGLSRICRVVETFRETRATV